MSDLFNIQYDAIRIKLLISEQIDMETNGVNYYKGVLLCSRPNESPSIPKQKPFCGRVTPYDAIGLVPTKKFDEHKVRKRNLPVLNNHKKWLQHFQKKIQQNKLHEQQEKQRQIEKLDKIKQEGLKRRQQTKLYSSTQSPNAPNLSPLELSQKKDVVQNQKHKEVKRINKKGQRPQWAKTEKQKQVEEDEQVDELLQFFANEQIKDYLEDEQFSKMMKDLKNRIQQMRKQGTKQGQDWKKKQAQRIQQARLQREDRQEEKKQDMLSRISKNSDAKSMASQKTAERVEELEKRKEEKEWDKNTAGEKKSYIANLDEQIAKNVADEVLRNYPALKHHSNQSIRKLLQKQAREQIKE